MATESPKNSSPADEVAKLSPAEQRALLEKLLRKKAESKQGVAIQAPRTIAADQQADPANLAVQADGRGVQEFPMSAGQTGLWHAFCRDPEATPFNVFLPTRIRSKLNLAALQQSIEQIAARHASLRTTFSARGEKLLQQVHPALGPEFRVLELPGANEEQVRELLKAEMKRPFDLRQGPLLRLFVVKLSDEDYVILATAHHIVTDFWSLVLILSELKTAYPAFARGDTPKFAPATNNFEQFVEQQRQLLCGPVSEELRDFWMENLKDVSHVVEIPTDFHRPSSFTHRAGNQRIEIGAELSRKVQSFARANRATVFGVLQSAVQVLVHRYTGQQKFLIGTPMVGRSHRDYESTVGFFVNMLPLKADLSNQPSFAQLAQNTSTALLDCLEHERYPVSQIVHDAKIPRDPSRSPLFQVSCTYEKSQKQDEAGRGGFLFEGETQVWNFGGLRQESFYLPHPTCHYDLEFIFEQSRNREIRGMLCFCEDLFQQSTAFQVAENYVGLLDSLIAHGPLPVDQVPWSVEPKDHCLEGQKFAVSADVGTVDRHLAVGAEKNPGELAFCFSNYTLTHREMLDASKCLSKTIRDRLGSLGNSTSRVIPVLCRRGPLPFIAAWAINQAGLAFVPVDADQPSLFIDDLLQDTQAPLVVCDRDSRNLLSQKSPPHLIIEDVLAPLAQADHGLELSEGSSASSEELAYLVYTSGSTGKPKGVALEHRAVCNTLRWRSEAVPLGPQDRVLMLLSHQFDAGLAIAWTTLTQGATLVMASQEEMRSPDAMLDLIIRQRVNVLPQGG